MKSYVIIITPIFLLIPIFNGILLSNEFSVYETDETLFRNDKKSTLIRTDNDLVISDTLIVTDSTITLNGNLIIESGGSLTLDNVNVFIHQHSRPYDEPYHIYANPGSKLIIYNSEIKAAQADETYIFVVDSAFFELNGSLIENIDKEGLQLNHVEGAIIQDNVFNLFSVESHWRGIKLDNSTFVTIQNNTITRNGNGTTAAIDLYKSHYNTIIHNRLYKHHVVVGLSYSWDNYVAHNEATLTQAAAGISIHAASGNNTIENNNLSAAEGHIPCIDCKQIY